MEKATDMAGILYILYILYGRYMLYIQAIQIYWPCQAVMPNSSPIILKGTKTIIFHISQIVSIHCRIEL